MKILLLAMSFFGGNIPDKVCNITWAQPTHDTDEKLLDDRIDHYQMYIKGVLQVKHQLTGKSHTWTDLQCPVTCEVQLMTFTNEVPPKFSVLSPKVACN